jgi:hypothetical protein
MAHIPYSKVLKGVTFGLVRRRRRRRRSSLIIAYERTT